MCLCDLSDTEPVLISVFLSKTDQTTKDVSVKLDGYSKLVECATTDLISLLTLELDAQLLGSSEIRTDIANVKSYFSTRNLDSLITCTRETLHDIKRRLARPTASYTNTNNSPTQPFFSSQIVLQFPSVVLSPSVDLLQQAINKSVTLILNVNKNIRHWNENKMDYFKQVSENKDVYKLVMSLSAAINVTKKEIHDQVAKLFIYKTLWLEDRDVKLKGFLDSNPGLNQFEVAIMDYEAIESSIVDLPATARVGAVELQYDSIKSTLIGETKAWKKDFGRYLNKKAAADMSEIYSMCDKIHQTLSKKLTDLDDVRSVMAGLSELRVQEIYIDNMIFPVEQAYAMLHRNEISITILETERLDSLEV